MKHCFTLIVITKYKDFKQHEKETKGYFCLILLLR